MHGNLKKKKSRLKNKKQKPEEDGEDEATDLGNGESSIPHRRGTRVDFGSADSISVL